MWVFVMPNIPTIFRIEADRDHVNWSKPAGIPPVSLWMAVAAALALVASILRMTRGEHHAFIYFQF
jgi:hypothetical protein